ncbi:MAG TPA: rhomboid family intramembrane serine protease [Acidobacteriaceae bacterium]|jgi:membrane associated rhomboid family serine protease|nr:rhomboid family intramembrane serine protease [Acidobacteriaceae bacterium]
MPSNGPTLLALPPFRGLTRRLILLAASIFILLFILGLVLPRLAALLFDLFSLRPDHVRLVWEFLTWPFITDSLLSLLFALFSFWFFGSALEQERGTRWFGELFFAASVGGALLATLISRTLGQYVHVISATGKYSNGLWPITIALLVAYARLHAEESLNFNFIFRARAKYIAAIFLVVYLLIDIFTFHRFDALNTVCDCLIAWLFLQLAPRRSMRYAASERWFGLRNSYYRSKRRRAAKKFQVYMRKQGKDVSIDASGRYIGLDDEDPTDKRHMN